MKRWIGLVFLVSLFCSASSVTWADNKSPTHYDLYSWKDGNDWTYALLPTSKERYLDAQIKQAGLSHGAGKIKEKLLGMKDGQMIDWRERPERQMVYPPPEIMQDILEYAQTVNVKMVVEKHVKSSLPTP